MGQGSDLRKGRTGATVTAKRYSVTRKWRGWFDDMQLRYRGEYQYIIRAGSRRRVAVVGDEGEVRRFYRKGKLQGPGEFPFLKGVRPQVVVLFMILEDYFDHATAREWCGVMAAQNPNLMPPAQDRALVEIRETELLTMLLEARELRDEVGRKGTTLPTGTIMKDYTLAQQVHIAR